IHESLDYLEGRATVFHSRYLCAWASTGATPSVALGHFVLPPAAVQEGRGEIEENILKHEDLALLGGHPVSGAFWGAQTRPCSSEEETGSRDPAQGEFPYRTLHEYPVNNMVTGYTSARDMKKYVGELRDFTPGTSGYTAYWIQNEINIYSEVKSKMKRKL
ncbi:hypothetical protein Q9233_009545, partial [Columba guinea]